MDKDLIGTLIAKHPYQPEEDGYSIDEIDSIGGECDGAEMSNIYEVTHLESGEKTLFRLDGYYSSWGDSTFDCKAYEVEEYIKEVKDWRKV